VNLILDISVDMRALVATEKRAETVDPIVDLAAVGVKGVIDPAKIITAYKLTTLQHKRVTPKFVMPYNKFLTNSALFELANGGENMPAHKLQTHCATDEAKASEREQPCYLSSARLCSTRQTILQSRAASYSSHIGCTMSSMSVTSS
jgi:hypothetical protein